METTVKDLELPYIASPLESSELQQIEHARREKQGLVDEHGPGDVAARYCVEVHFHHKRSITRPYAGIIFTLLKGSTFGGGGLKPMYACADQRCRGYISTDNYSPTLEIAACPVCQRAWHPSQVFSHRKYILSTQHWAFAISRIVLRFGLDADVKLIYFGDPLIAPTIAASENHRLGLDPVEASRHKIKTVVYPLGRLITDLSTGVELEKRMHALITA